MGSWYFNGVLKDQNKNQKTYIHPETNSRQVLTGERYESNLQQDLNNINDKFEQILANETNKGAFASKTALTNKYPDKTDDPLSRAGWTAIVENEDKIYFYDTQEEMWKPSAAESSGSRIKSVNGKTDENIVLTGKDINSTIDSNSTKTITQHLQDIKNITSDLNTDIQSLGDKSINGQSIKNNVTLTASNINANSGKTIQEELSGLSTTQTTQGTSVQQLQSKVEELLNEANVIYLNEQEMQNTSNLENGQVVVCVEEGTYKLGSIYQLNNGVWEEITSSGGTEITDTLTLSKTIYVPELTATITYESLTTNYPWFKDSDDYWSSPIDFPTWRGTTLRIHINLNRETNLVFAFEQTGGNLQNTYLSFGKIDKELAYPNDYSDDSLNTYQNLKDLSSGKVTYENFPSGEHFIDVKYRTYSGTPTGTGKIKIIGGLDLEAYDYESSQSITIGDKNNLQIDNSNICTMEQMTRTKLHGEENNPIILSTLPSGRYLLSGYFKWHEINKNIFSVLKVENDALDSVELDVNDSSKTTGNDEHKYKTITLYNCNLEFGYVAVNAHVSKQQQYVTTMENWTTNEYSIYPTFQPKISSTFTMMWNKDLTTYSYVKTPNTPPTKLWNNVWANLTGASTFLDTKNTIAYTPTSDYHPATKKYIDDLISGNTPIKLVDDIETNINKDNQNKIIKLNQASDRHIYYVKEGEPILKNPVVNQKYESLYINKDIVTGTTDLETFKISMFPSSSSYVYTNTNSFIQFSIENSQVTKIFSGSSLSGYDTMTVFYENGVWYKNEIIAEDLWSRSGSPTSYPFVCISKTAEVQEAISTNSIHESVFSYEGIKLANYEDLENAGGGIDEDALKQYLPKVIKLG